MGPVRRRALEPLDDRAGCDGTVASAQANDPGEDLATGGQGGESQERGTEVADHQEQATHAEDRDGAQEEGRDAFAVGEDVAG